MSLKKILAGAIIMPALVVAGCSCQKEEEKEVVYSEVSQQETITFLNQVKENEGFKIDGYQFKTTLSVPKNIYDGGLDGSEEDLGEGEESSETTFPDTSDTTKWENIKIDGFIINKDNSLQVKFEMTSPEENEQIYIKDNVAYLNDGTNKYKATFNSDQDMEEFIEVGNLPTTEMLLEQIDMILASQEGLKFEKGTLDGNDYYHIYGTPKFAQEDPMFSFNVEVPVDLYLTFENGQLVSYKFKTILLFFVTEFEVAGYNGEITFPEDLDSYIENKDAVLGE